MPALKIALIQLDTAWEDPATNLERAGSLAREVVSSGASLAVYPEMMTTGFSMRAHALRSIEGSAGALAEIASKNSISLLAGAPFPGGERGRGLNKALAFDSGGALVAEYSKMHPFGFADEDRHYSPGGGPAVFELCSVASSVFICYDLRFPEAFRRVAREVKVIYVLANWPAARQEHWVTLLRARAIENLCYVVGVNRVGRDGNGVDYAGGSAVFGPFGEVVYVAGPAEGVHVVDIDTDHVEKVRAAYPFLDDMRAE